MESLEKYLLTAIVVENEKLVVVNNRSVYDGALEYPICLHKFLAFLIRRFYFFHS